MYVETFIYISLGLQLTFKLSFIGVVPVPLTYSSDCLQLKTICTMLYVHFFLFRYLNYLINAGDADRRRDAAPLPGELPGGRQAQQPRVRGPGPRPLLGLLHPPDPAPQELP